VARAFFPARLARVEGVGGLILPHLAVGFELLLGGRCLHDLGLRHLGSWLLSRLPPRHVVVDGVRLVGLDVVGPFIHHLHESTVSIHGLDL